MFRSPVPLDARHKFFPEPYRCFCGFSRIVSIVVDILIVTIVRRKRETKVKASSSEMSVRCRNAENYNLNFHLLENIELQKIRPHSCLFWTNPVDISTVYFPQIQILSFALFVLNFAIVRRVILVPLF
jgi:hypothetical protein